MLATLHSLRFPERGDAGPAAPSTLSRPQPSHPGPAQAAPPPRPAADKAAPRLPARPDQALHKAPHFRPAPARSRRPHAFRTYRGLRLRHRRAPARAGTACGSATGSAQTTHRRGRPLGPRCLPLAWPRPALPPTLRRHRSPRPHFRPPRAGRGRAGHVTQLRARAPVGVREVPGCWHARPGPGPQFGLIWKRCCRK